MQTLNPSEISELIKSRIEKVKLAAEARNEGTVTSVSDGIVRIHGLADVMQGEMIELPNATYALALNLERDSVGAVVLGDYEHLREGDVAKTTGRILEVPVGPELLGRVVNALGEPIDGKGPIAATMTAPPISAASTAVATSTSWPKRRRSDARSFSSSAASSGCAEVTVARTTRSASALSWSYSAEISGSSTSRRLSASTARKRPKVGSLSPGGSSSSTSVSSATCGDESADCTPGTTLACAAKPSMVDHGARRPDSFASANAARA